MFELLFELILSKHCFVFTLKIDDFVLNRKFIEKKFCRIPKIKLAFSKFSRNLIRRQVTELNAAVEYHNFIFGCYGIWTHWDFLRCMALTFSEFALFYGKGLGNLQNVMHSGIREKLCKNQ